MSKFYCGLCETSHHSLTNRFKCPECARYFCKKSYQEIMSVGRDSCPYCNTSLSLFLEEIQENQALKPISESKHIFKNEHQEILDSINIGFLKNFYEGKNKKQFRNWNKTIVFSFNDLQKTWFSTINGGIPSPLIEGEPAKADVVIISDSATWLGIMRREISGMGAYTRKKLQIKGGFRDLLKLTKLLKD